MTNSTFRDEIRKLRTTLNPQVVADSLAIYGRHQNDAPRGDGAIIRDIAYGPHARHRLDVFEGNGGHDRPVLLYVHGGGFVGGDKVLPGTAFYDNVGSWATQQGFVGVTMTYRLAPDHPWPAGGEDVAAAIRWLRQNIADHGGAADRIFVAGQSAGATHVASYLTMPDLHDAVPPVAGALLFSGLYDVPTLHKGPLENQYFGEDDGLSEQQSSLAGLIAREVPMLFTVAQHDPLNFQKQAAILVHRWFAAKEAWPRMLYLPDANHMSAALGIGGIDQFLAPEIAAFIDHFSEPPA
jgi:triacylglycerol lipase